MEGRESWTNGGVSNDASTSIRRRYTRQDHYLTNRMLLILPNPLGNEPFSIAETTPGRVLGPIDIEVTCSQGTFLMDPNKASFLAATEQFPFAGPVLDAKSDISSEPAYLIRTSEATLALTQAEALALWRRELSPPQYQALRAKHGVIFEIHDDFYDDDGRALQPMG